MVVMTEDEKQRKITAEQGQWGAVADRLMDAACPAILNLLGLPDNVKHALMLRSEKGFPKKGKDSGEFDNEQMHRHYEVSFKRDLKDLGEHEFGLREELDVRRTSPDFETKKEIREGFSLWTEITRHGQIGGITYSKSTEGAGMSINGDNKQVAANIQILVDTL